MNMARVSEADGASPEADGVSSVAAAVTTIHLSFPWSVTLRRTQWSPHRTS